MRFWDIFGVNRIAGILFMVGVFFGVLNAFFVAINWLLPNTHRFVPHAITRSSPWGSTIDSARWSLSGRSFGGLLFLVAGRCASSWRCRCPGFWLTLGRTCLPFVHIPFPRRRVIINVDGLISIYEIVDGRRSRSSVSASTFGWLSLSLRTLTWGLVRLSASPGIARLLVLDRMPTRSRQTCNHFVAVG